MKITFYTNEIFLYFSPRIFLAKFHIKRSEPPISPRHHASIVSNNRSSETISTIMQTPIPSMITLRDTSIREQSSLSIKDSSNASSYFRGSSFNNNSGYNSSTFSSSRERDCSSPFLNSSGSNSNSSQYNNLSSLGSRENNTIILRDSGPIAHRVASNRFLSSGIDQRIIKQSTEDCRRLLQQVAFHFLTFLEVKLKISDLISRFFSLK